MKRVVLLAAILSAALAGLPARGQAPHAANPAMPPLPAGFTPTADADMYSGFRDAGMGDGASGERVNRFPSACFGTIPNKSKLVYLWLKTNTDFQSTLAELAKTPEDPPSHQEILGVDNAPDGKSEHKGGVLIWRKLTWSPGPMIDDGNHCPGKTVITYTVTWEGLAAGRRLSVSLSSYYGDKQSAQRIIDRLIDGLMRIANAK